MIKKHTEKIPKNSPPKKLSTKNIKIIKKNRKTTQKNTAKKLQNQTTKKSQKKIHTSKNEKKCNPKP